MDKPSPLGQTSDKVIPFPLSSAASSPGASASASAQISAGSDLSSLQQPQPGAAAGSIIPDGGSSSEESRPEVAIHPDPLTVLHTAVADLTNGLAYLKAQGNLNSNVFEATLDSMRNIERALATADTPANNAELATVLAQLTKPGVKTTGFWLALIASVGTLLAAVGGVMTGHDAAWVLIIGNALYIFSRTTLAKSAVILLQKSLPLLLAALLLTGFAGCTATSPYYVSGVTVGIGQNGDGKEVTAGIQIAPNPYDHKAVVPFAK